jgi:hypothetical protein
MQDSSGPESPTPRKLAPIVMVVLAATMVGSSLGILIADRDALSVLKRRVAGQAAANTSTAPSGTKPGIAGNKGLNAVDSRTQPQSEILSTGFKALGAIRYSAQADFTQVAFDLKDMDLIRTEKLSGPNRVYVDLQEIRRQKGTRKRLKAKKTLSIDGDLISKVRIAQWDTGALRIVLDLKCSCNFTYQTPKGSPSLLIVELRPHTMAEPISKMN